MWPWSSASLTSSALRPDLTASYRWDAEARQSIWALRRRSSGVCDWLEHEPLTDEWTLLGDFRETGRLQTHIYTMTAHVSVCLCSPLPPVSRSVFSQRFSAETQSHFRSERRLRPPNCITHTWSDDMMTSVFICLRSQCLPVQLWHIHAAPLVCRSTRSVTDQQRVLCVLSIVQHFANRMKSRGVK